MFHKRQDKEALLPVGQGRDRKKEPGKNRAGATGPPVKDKLIGPRTRLTEANLKSVLRDMNMKVTHQRLSILRSINKGPKTHVTAQDVFEQVRGEHPHIGFATVYRFLKKTSQFGITSELRMGYAPARYELKTPNHHHHITCTQCGIIIEFQNEKIERQIKKIIKEHKFSLEHHVFELYGRCHRPTCRS